MEEQRGEPFTVELPREPEEHQRALLETLGVHWTVAVSATETRFATCWGCKRVSVCETAGSCWIKASEAGRARAQAPSRASSNGRAALERMDAGEPQQPTTAAPTKQAAPAVPSPAAPNGARAARTARWTRETIVAGIKEYAREHGHPPTSTRPPGQALAMACGRLGWKWADAVEAAGYPRPTKGTKYRGQAEPLGAGEPREAPQGPSTALRQPRGHDTGPVAADVSSPAPSGPGVSEPAERALPAEETVVAAPAGEAVEPAHEEPPGSGATRAPGPLGLPPPVRVALADLLTAIAAELRGAE